MAGAIQRAEAVYVRPNQEDKFVGNRFGMLTVMEDSGKRRGNSILWRCECDCGGEILAARHQLVSGSLTNCGCIPRQARPKVTDLIGRRFGKLTVLEDSGQRDNGGGILWRCKCDCGGQVLARRRQLISGSTVSCGCVQRQYAPKHEAEDLTGRQFGELTVLRRAENDSRSKVCWVCRCSCGKECTVQASKLKSGSTRSCGCRRYTGSHNQRDLTGRRFGRLTVLYQADKKDTSDKVVWHCKCDCGNEVDVLPGSLLRGLTQSCGCWNREQSAKMHEHMHYQDDTCIERLERIYTDPQKNKAGFRGLFLTKNGSYRVMITFRRVHYTLGYYRSFEEAVRVRLNAEEALHAGYMEAYKCYQEKAEMDPGWMEENPFFYEVHKVNGEFRISTNGNAGTLP